jgi:Zn-dependent alcohol dehydrogenase
MSTHNAVAAISIRAPLGIIQHPTIQPTGREVLVRVDWTASTPLDLHINDGGLYLDGPVVLGDSCAGVVIQVGPDVKMLAVGDEVCCARPA